MKILISITIIASLAIFILAQSSILNSGDTEHCGNEINNLVLCIETTNSKYNVDEEIVLQSYLKNNSQEAIQLTNSNSDYSLVIKREDNSIVSPLDNPHKFILKGWRSGRNTLEIQPQGKSYKMFVLTDSYDFINPGTYTILLKRTLQNSSDKSNNKEISSQEIIIEVSENSKN